MSATYEKSNPSAREWHATPQDDMRLAAFSLSALRESQPSRLIERAVTVAAEGLQVDFCTVLALEPDGEALRVVASHGWPESRLGRRMTLTECAQCQLALERYSDSGARPLDLLQPVVIEDLRSDESTKDTFRVRELGVISSLCAVVPGSERPYGTLVAHSRKPRRFDSGECEFLAALASLLAAALERCRAHAALQKSEERFRSLTELSSDWYWEQDAELRFTFVSEGFFQRSSIRREDVLGKRRWEFPVGSPLDSTWDAHRATLAAHLPFRNFEFARLEADGTKRFQSASGDPVFDANGRFTGYRGTGRDITARVRVGQRLREQRRLLVRAQELAGLGYWEYEMSSGLISGSRELRRILAIADALPGQTLEWGLNFLDPQDRERVSAAIGRAIERDTSFELEARVTTTGGQQRIMVISGEGVKDGARKVSKVIGSCLDITERQRRENALSDSTHQLQVLSQRLVEAQETERRHLAAELHDQVGQNLTALSINLDIVAARLDALEGGGDLKRRLQDSLALLEATSHCIEGVLDGLRPPMLEHWGIGPTVQWVAEEFTSRTEIPAPVRVLGTERRIDPQNELALVRIVQEALNNVAKHAHAGRIEILVVWETDSVRVEVADDGIGFEEKGFGGPQGLGLLSMRERVQAANGVLDIESARGKGTRVRACVPG